MRRRDGNKRRRVERQEQAAARQATYDALSLAEKIDRTNTRPGISEREHLRLTDGEPVGGVRLA